MGPTEYCTTILLPKPSQNLPCVLLMEPGIPDCRLPCVFSKRKLFLIEGTAWRTTHLTTSRAFSVVLMSTFYGRDVTSSFTHLSITFSNQRFSNCSPTVDVGFVKLTSDSSWGNSLQDEYSVLPSPVLQ
jgi:hypothetical protein